MGRRHNEVASEEKIVPYEVVGGPEDYVKVKVGDKEMTPPEISAKILRKLKEAAEAYLGQKVNKAVITVPAYFNDAQRQATKDAGEIAGLEVARIINEPTAAALAYGLDARRHEKIVRVRPGRRHVRRVGAGSRPTACSACISTNGDTHLGGDDFDQVLINCVADEFKKEQGIDLRKDTMALQRLQEACEKAKKELELGQHDRHQSAVHHGRCQRPEAFADDHHPQQVRAVGRSPDRAVPRAGGAGPQGRQAAAQRDRRSRAGRRCTRIPKVQELVRKIFGKEPHKGVNPDEVVAVGAAIQGGVLAGEVQDVLLLDVTPLSLGIETLGGVMTGWSSATPPSPPSGSNVSARPTTIRPRSRSSVFQGEREMAADNRLLGQFNLEGIPPAPRGMPQIEVKFDIDANGILNVAAKDLAPARSRRSRSSSPAVCRRPKSSGCARTPNCTPTRTRRSGNWPKLRNQADSMCFQLEKMMKEQADKIKPADKAPLEAAIDKTREVAKANDVDAIKSAIAELEQASHAMSKTLYEAGKAAGAAPSTVPAGAKTAAPSRRRRRGRHRRRVRSQGAKEAASTTQYLRGGRGAGFVLCSRTAPRVIVQTVPRAEWQATPGPWRVILRCPHPGEFRLGREPMTMAFRFDKLTIKAQEAVASAQQLAADRGNPQIDPLHLLAGLLR